MEYAFVGQGKSYNLIFMNVSAGGFMDMTDYAKCFNMFVIITTLYLVIQSEAQTYIITESASSAESGKPFTFTCQTTPPEIAVSWTETSMDNTASTYTYVFSGSCQKSTGTPPADYVFDCNSTGTFTVTFNPTFERHAGSQWKCGNSIAPTPESSVLVPNVTVPLTSISMNISPGLVVTEGTLVTITCSTNPCNPLPPIIWMKDGNEYQDPSITQTDTRKTNGFVRISEISKKVSVSDSGNYSCKAVYGTQTVLSNSILLVVQGPSPDCECEIICIVLSVLVGVVGCGCEVAAIVVIVIVCCMFQLVTGTDTLIYELTRPLAETELEQKLKHGLKKLKVNHKIVGNMLRITLKNAEFQEKELKTFISNLKTIVKTVEEKVFPVWAKFVIFGAGLLGFLLGVIGIILQQVLCCLGECLALLILAIIALVIGVVVIIIWIAWIRTWIFYKRKKSNGNPEARNSPIPLTGSQIHTTPSEKKTPRGEPPKKMLEQKVRSIDELKEIKKKPPPVFKGNGQSQNNPREPSPISQSDSVASSSDVAVHHGKTKVTHADDVRM